MIEIKTASEKDIPVIEDILSDTVKWLNSIDKPLWTESQIKWERLSEDFSASDFYIAYFDGKPAGCMAVVDYDPQFWADIPKGESLFIHKLAAKRFAAGKGLSDALISHAKSMCIERGISKLRLDCHSLIPKLRAVYERNGFICVEEKILYGKYHMAFYECEIRDTKGMDNKTGWEQDKRVHFDDIVVNYDKIRPEYPDKLFEDVIGFTGTDKKKAIEIGAGTGKATKPFLDAGYDVTAVEIGENMAEFLRKKFRKYKNFNVITAAFEGVELKADSYDLIYAASAFHWVDAEIGCAKAFRLLKSGGVFALLRYNFLATHNEALDDEIHAVYEKYYFSYYTSKPRTVRYRRSHDEFRESAEILKNYGFEDMKNYDFSDVSLRLYDVTWTYDADEYIALLETFSDHRHLPEENRAALYAGVKEKIINNGGYLKGEDVFQLYMGRKL